MVAQSLANAATLSLLQVDPQVDLQIVVRRIHVAVESRNAVEQAQGMLCQRFSIDVEEAFVRLRASSRDLGLSLMDAVGAVLGRRETEELAAALARVRA
jgi:AmiR/NasT family two-component response regulator